MDCVYSSFEMKVKKACCMALLDENDQPRCVFIDVCLFFALSCFWLELYVTISPLIFRCPPRLQLPWRGEGAYGTCGQLNATDNSLK